MVKTKEIGLNLPNAPYGQAKAFDVTFAPGETVEVRTISDHGPSGNAHGHAEINYLLQTGKGWQGGKVAHTRIEVKPNVRFYPIPAHFASELEISPKGASIEEDGEFRKIIWDLKDVKEGFNLHYPYMVADEYVNLFGCNVNEEEKDCKKLRIMRNTLYAWYGYSFKDKDLKSYFSKQWWYKEDPKFDIKKLPALDQTALLKTVEVIKKQEKANKCK